MRPWLGTSRCAELRRGLEGPRGSLNQRLFVAIDLPEAVGASLERLCVGLPGARWTDPEQYHLTLRFIGEVDGLSADDIYEGLAEVDFEPFGPACMASGTRREAKVLWAGVTPESSITPLRRAVDRVSTPQGSSGAPAL